MRKQPKRICFLTTLPVTLNSFVRPQAEYLVRNGWEVTWMCAEDGDFAKNLPDNVRYIRIPVKRGVDPVGILRAIERLYRLFKSERFDLVQYSTPNAAFCASIAGWLVRVPVRLYAQWGIRYVGFSGPARRFFKILERCCCACSTIIEPDSFSNLEFSIKERLYPRRKGRVIWNGSACGVNLERFDIRQKDAWRNDFRNKLGFKPEDLVIGFVGSIRKDKGCAELFGACRKLFRKIPEAALLLIGDKVFYDTIDANDKAWAETNRRVVFVPPNNQIPMYMACMDIFAMPSYREGFGLVIVEAAAMGVPAVVSNVPGPTDAVQHQKTGLVVPVKNVSALIEALESLLRNGAQRAAYGAAAVKHVRDNFEQNEFLRRALADKESLLFNRSCGALFME